MIAISSTTRPIGPQLSRRAAAQQFIRHR